MPEIAEVETVARGLRRLAGRRILRVRFGKTDFIHNVKEMQTLLPGSRIGEIRRYGKLLAVAVEREDFDGGSNWLLIHLGMTGQLVLGSPDDRLRPHTHVQFTLDDGHELRYMDARRFGHMRIASPEELVTLSPSGAEPLDVSIAEFRSRLGSRRARLKALLLDQSVLRGLGNIYADESLWRARLHPALRGCDLTPAELDRIWKAIRRVVREAIRHNGTSIADYVDADGRPGSNQRRLRAYHRQGYPCSRCGTKIQRTIIAGRGTHFCPRCQPVPKNIRSRARAGLRNGAKMASIAKNARIGPGSQRI